MWGENENSRLWGNCGFANGASLGAKIGAPDRRVFAIRGDGAWGTSGLSEVMTAVQENAVIFRNYDWGAEKENQIDYYDDRFVRTNVRENPSFFSSSGWRSLWLSGSKQNPRANACRSRRPSSFATTIRFRTESRAWALSFWMPMESK